MDLLCGSVTSVYVKIILLISIISNITYKLNIFLIKYFNVFVSTKFKLVNGLFSSLFAINIHTNSFNNIIDIFLSVKFDNFDVIIISINSLSNIGQIVVNIVVILIL